MFNFNLNKPPLVYNSLLITDAYEVYATRYFLHELPASQAVWRHTNRSRDHIKFADYIDENELRRQFDHASRITLKPAELDYIASLTDPYGNRLVDDHMLQFLKTYHMPRFQIRRSGNEYDIRVQGLAYETSWNETPGMAILTDVMTRARVKKLGLTMDQFYEDADRVLDQNIALIQTRPNLPFSEFGLRRAYTIEWHTYMVKKLHQAFVGKKQYAGTSRLDMSMELGTPQIGTIPHKVFMITAAWLRNHPDQLKQVQKIVMEKWSRLFPGLKTMLSDTYPGTFWNDFMEFALSGQYDTVRPDSGNPFQNGIDVISKNYEWNTNLNVLFSDAVNIELAIKLFDYFIEYFVSKFGLGSVWSCNGTILSPVSHVIKPYFASSAESNLYPCVKQTLNGAKTMGESDEVSYYNSVLNYNPADYPNIPVVY